MSISSLNFLLHRTLKIFDFGFVLQSFSDTDLKDAPWFMLGPIFVKKKKIVYGVHFLIFFKIKTNSKYIFDLKLTKQLVP